QTASRQQRLSASPELARQLPTERAGKVVLSRAQLFSREQRLETCARTLDQLCDVIGCGRVDKIAHASSLLDLAFPHHHNLLGQSASFAQVLRDQQRSHQPPPSHVVGGLLGRRARDLFKSSVRPIEQTI